MITGHQSWRFERPPVIIATASVVGPDEAEGPLGKDFDLAHGDLYIEQKSWEQAEKKLLEDAATLALEKAHLNKEDIQFYIGGDLLNQTISNGFAARTFGMPYLGIFGACSTSMQGLALAAQLVNAGAANYAMAGTCSHNCTSEKQFRYPTEYGSQKPPTAQYTVTGAGVAIVAAEGEGPLVTKVTIGRIVDMGITDPFNMGAAMAPAAVDTIQTHFRELALAPDYYDLIVTGDLGFVGSTIAKALLKEQQFPLEQTTYNDCGLMIFDREKQTFVNAGGSGCGCAATVTYGHLMKQLAAGTLQRILIVATGALFSPLSFQQGESIPCIAHAVAIENRGAVQ